MVKRISCPIFCIIFCIFSFLTVFSGCSTQTQYTKIQSETRYSEEKITIIPTETTEQIKRSQAVLEDGVWNTQDVDISHINPSKKLISFTFDDAPKRSLESILAVYASFNETHPNCKASGTIFCNGNLIDNDVSQSLQTALTLGFELGNHTFSHYDLTKLDKQTLQEEITKTDELLSRVDGKDRHLFRAPYGRINDDINPTIPVPVIDWTIDTLDWTGASVEAIYETVFSQKFSGAIVLMHDGYPNTVYALKRLLPDLEEAGYQVVSVSAMAKMHDCKLKAGSVYIRARKNGTTVK